MERKVQVWLAAGGALVAAVTLFATCGGCGRHGADGKPAATSGLAVDGAVPVDAGPPPRSEIQWEAAKGGEVEDLALLAVSEGAAGLVEAAKDPELRPTALRALAYARGYAQLPFLAEVASARDDAEAAVALDAVVEIAARPRRQEDPEDAEELKTACAGLLALARDAPKPRTRRVQAIRALRMLPCTRADVPTDLDAK